MSIQGLDGNPWLTIWIHPKKTIRAIVESDPQYQIIVIAVFLGLSNSLNRASMQNLGDRLPLSEVLISSLVAAVPTGIISFYIFGAILRWTGRWLGGRASYAWVRAAIAWGSVPIIWRLLLWIPELALFREELFTSQTPRIDANPGLAALLLLFGLIEMVVGIWGIVVLLHCLAEVHGFSTWKALGAFLLGIFLVLLPILCLVVVVGLLTGGG